MKHSMILVANRTHARVFTADSSKSPLVEINTMVHPEGRLHERDITSDLPGKAGGSAGTGGHAYADETDVKKHELTEFAKQIADYIEKARTENVFANLILVAAPKMLGELRSHLSNDTKYKIAIELDKNMTQHDASDIRSRLPKYLTHD